MTASARAKQRAAPWRHAQSMPSHVAFMLVAGTSNDGYMRRGVDVMQHAPDQEGALLVKTWTVCTPIPEGCSRTSSRLPPAHAREHTCKRLTEPVERHVAFMLGAPATTVICAG